MSLVIFKCLPFFIYQHIETLVSQVKEFPLLKILCSNCIPSLCGILLSYVPAAMSWCYCKTACGSSADDDVEH